MSTRKFSVGDRVRVNCPDGSPHHGEETTVTACDVPGFGWDCGRYVGYEVDCVMFGHRAIFEAHELIPIYDGRETVSWEQCCWQPRALKV